MKNKLRSLALTLASAAVPVLIAVTLAVPLTLSAGVRPVQGYSGCTSASAEYEWQVRTSNTGVLASGHSKQRARFCYNSDGSWANTAFSSPQSFYYVSGPTVTVTGKGYYRFSYTCWGRGPTLCLGTDWWVNTRYVWNGGTCTLEYYLRLKTYADGNFNTSGTSSKTVVSGGGMCWSNVYIYATGA